MGKIPIYVRRGRRHWRSRFDISNRLPLDDLENLINGYGKNLQIRGHEILLESGYTFTAPNGLLMYYKN